ncbi:hypothetical protein ACRCUN_00205 [Mycobacterium sp. LTG2003]
MSQDVEDAMNSVVLHGIRLLVETMPLDGAFEGYRRMMANRARFGVVLTVDQGVNG